ncbi:hypothetical protein EON82_13825 [bacterium]|nr:MAG: hypothetical protein EON82_13825 [bacterium]
MKVAHWTASSRPEPESTRRPAVSLFGLILWAPAVVLLSVCAWWMSFWPLSAMGLVGLLFYARRAVDSGNDSMASQERQQALLEGFERETGWIVNLMVHHGSAPVGSDRGVLWIEDDRLYFCGQRTSFGLTADQASDFCRNDAAIPGLRNSLELRLRHQTAVGPMSISFSSVDAGGSVARNQDLPLLGAVNLWIGRGAETDGQLPPLTPGPDAESSSRLLRRSVGAFAYWAAIPIGLAFGWNASPLMAVTLAIAGIGIGTVWTPVWSPFLRLRAWKDRQRLSRNLG